MSRLRQSVKSPSLHGCWMRWGVGPGNQLELEEGPEGFILRPRRIDPTRLAPLRTKLKHGCDPFDIESFREQAYDPTLRD